MDKREFLDICSDFFDIYHKRTVDTYVMGTIKKDAANPISLMLFQGDGRHQIDLAACYTKSKEKFKQS